MLLSSWKLPDQRATAMPTHRAWICAISEMEGCAGASSKVHLAPEVEPAEERGDVRYDPHVGRQIDLQLLGVPAAQMDQPAVPYRLDLLDHLEHAPAPLLAPDLLHRSLAHVLAVGLLFPEGV